MKNIIIVLFVIPFIFSALSLQAFIAKFISVNLSQVIAYLNVGLVIFGIILFIKFYEIKVMPKTIKLWFIFFGLYYSIGIIGNIIYKTEVPFLKTLISPIYLLGYIFFLSYKNFRKLFILVVISTFTVANILLIYFKYKSVKARLFLTNNIEIPYKYDLITPLFFSFYSWQGCKKSEM